MTTYSYRDYTIDISFNSELKVYEGNSKETCVYLMDETSEKVEERFRDYIHTIVADLEYNNVRLLVYNTYLEEEGQLFGEFAKRDPEIVFFGNTVEEIKKQFEEYMKNKE